MARWKKNQAVAALRRALLVVALVFLIACTRKQAATTPPPARQNLAVQLMMVQEPNAKCLGFYDGAGENAVHSAVCRLPDKRLVYCSISTDKGPACPTGTTAPEPAKSAPAVASPIIPPTVEKPKSSKVGK